MALSPSLTKLLDKGQERFGRYQSAHRRYFGRPARGQILDFGCGGGGFLLAALQAGMNAYGVEVDEARKTQFDQISRLMFPQWRERFTLYPGRLLHYRSKSFDAVYSWFVFEHVRDPQTSLRELVRIMKPGATLYIQAEEVRNHWEGHALAPWPAYLPREFAAAYLEGLGKAQNANFVAEDVVYISAPCIVDILTTLGMDIIYANQASGRPSIPGGLYVTNDDEARALGRKMKDSGLTGPVENLSVVARKPDTI